MKNLWYKVINPSSRLENPEKIYRSRLLSAIVISILLIILLMLGVTFWGSPEINVFSIYDMYIGIFSFLLFVVVYIINKRGYYRLGASLIVAVISIAVFTSSVVVIGGLSPYYNRGDLGLLVFLVFPLLFSGLLLPLKHTVITAIAIICGMLLIPVFFSHIMYSDLFLGPLLLFSVIFLLVGWTKYHRNSLEKLRQQKLIKSRERYKLLVDTLDEGIWEIDEEGYTTFVNPKMAEMLEYSVEEMKGKHLFNFMDEDQVELAEKKLKDRSQGVGEQHRFIFRKKNGEPVYTFLSTSPIFDEEGNYKGALAGVTDITELKNAENALRESEKKYRNLVENVNDVLYTTDINGVITYISPSIENISGFSPSEIIGESFFDFIYEKDLPDLRKKFIEVKRGDLESHEYRILTKSGEIRWIRTSSKPVSGEKGLVGLRGVLTDITERKEAEEKVRENEERFRTFINSTSNMTFLKNEKLCHLVVNRAYLDFLGRKEEEVVGKTDFEILPVELAEQCRKSDMDALQGNRTIVVEEKIGDRIFETRKFPVKLSSGFRGVGGIVTDITERKRAQRELQKMEKLESLGVLAGGIAHDFNNILTAIMGNISIAKVKAEEEIKDILVDVEKASKKAKKLTEQLLTFSRGGEPVKEVGSIQGIIKESAEFVLHGSNVECRFNFSSELWNVNIDKGQMSQVINNLIINADQSMPEGGDIRISGENVIIEENNPMHLEKGKYIKVKISDEGVGIPERHIEKIFDPYFSTKSRGSGLGLATVYSIIKKHDGYVGVYSNLGVGTTFYFYLPAHFEEAELKEKIKKMNGVKSEIEIEERRRILLMDDNEIVRNTVSRMIESRGHDVVTTKDGEEALEEYRKAGESGDSFDVVILDLTVKGGMGGKEAMVKLKEIDPGVKAIVSSGYSHDPVMSNYEEHGFQAFIEKPFTCRKLLNVISELFG